MHYKNILSLVILFFTVTVYAAPVPGTIKWSFDVQGAIDSAPVIATDGTIYAASQTEHIWAINPDGSKKWAFPTVYRPSGSPFVDNNGNIFFTANNDNYTASLLTAVAPNGTQLWSIELNNPLFPSAQITTIFAFSVSGTDDTSNVLFVYDKEFIKSAPAPDCYNLMWRTYDSRNGHLISMFGVQTFDNIYPSPSIGRRPFFDTSVQAFAVPFWVVNDTPNFVLLSYPNADPNWNFETIANPSLDTTKVFSNIGGDKNGTIYFGDILGNLVAYRIFPFISAYPVLLWRASLDGDISHGAPVIDTKGNIYVGSSNGYLYVLLPDGTFKFKIGIDPSGINKEVALDSDGTIYITANSGNVYAVDSNGKAKWTFAANASTAPVVGVDGTIYVGTLANTVIAINGESTT